MERCGLDRSCSKRPPHSVGDLGYEVANVDVTVVCETPKIAPMRMSMRGRLAAAMGIDPDRVSVKGKTNEGDGLDRQG